MKPNIVPATIATASSPLTALPTAKIVTHPRAKKRKEEDRPLDPPSEETIQRLNILARQYPFCIRHRSNYYSQLL